MSRQRHPRRSQGGTTPETTPHTGSGVSQFSVSEVAQVWMPVDTANGFPSSTFSLHKRWRIDPLAARLATQVFLLR
jgi:hypothetical protein